MEETQKGAGFYIIATPIGNLGDISERAKGQLALADVIVAEDTRKTGRLLGELNLKKKMISCPDFQEDQRIPQVLACLRSKQVVCLVSDAGMPTISDPGFRLIRAVLAEGYPVFGIPGPSAVLLALAVSGLPTDRFIFDGFFPRKPGRINALLKAYAEEARTIVFFESPHRIERTLNHLAEHLDPARPLVIARELTKTHEEVIRGTLAEVITRTKDRRWLGEITVVLAGAGKD